MNRCNIVGDLLPLYVDGLTSEDSGQFIEEHVAGCPACRALLEQMRAPLETEQSQEFSNFLAAMRRRRRRTVLLSALAGLVVCVLLACVLWLNVPRTADLAVQSVAFRVSDGASELTTLRISGSWTPDWFGGAEATFTGSVSVDSLPGTDPATHSVGALKFGDVSLGGHLAITFISTVATDTEPARLTGSLRLYYHEETGTVLVYYMDHEEEQNDWMIVSDCASEAEARAVLADLPVSFGTFD